MIEKIEILQHCEGRYLGSHPREEARRFLCIVAYHHELVIELRKDRLNSLPKTLVGPGRRCPVLLVQPIRHIKCNVGSLKQVQLYRSTQVALVSKDRTVVVLPLHILQILQVVHISCSHVVGMYDSSDTTQSMKLVAVVVHVLRCTVAPGWCMLYIILSHLTPVGTCVLAHFDRLGIDAEYILASVDSLSNGLTDTFAKQHGLLTALVILPTGNQVWNGSRALRVQPREEVVLTVDTECLCCDGKCYHLQVGEGGYDTAASDISSLVYLISCKFLADLKNFPNFVMKLRISTIIVLGCFDATKVLKINDMCNFLSINILRI